VSPNAAGVPSGLQMPRSKHPPRSQASSPTVQDLHAIALDHCLALWAFIKMRVIGLVASCLTALATLSAAELNITTPETSKQILPNTFKPPQVFQHANLVRTVNLVKSYAKETVNVVVENVDKQPQSEYYIPFELGTIARVGGLEVRDKNAPEKRFTDVELVEFDTRRLVPTLMG